MEDKRYQASQFEDEEVHGNVARPSFPLFCFNKKTFNNILVCTNTFAIKALGWSYKNLLISRFYPSTLAVFLSKNKVIS
jgi:hypothetical protein